jgi:integrative and conjugative element protein (TIGR02256 family)
MAIAPELPNMHPAMTDRQQPTISISQRAVALMLRECAAATDGCETGGILLGSTDGHRATVVHAGTPGPNAVATPTRFSRDRAHAQAFADACHAADGSVWIGEWHTHPRHPPVPSEHDLITYSQLLRDDELDFVVFISLILTPSGTGVAVAGWWCTLEQVLAAQIRPVGQEEAP